MEVIHLSIRYSCEYSPMDFWREGWTQKTCQVEARSEPTPSVHDRNKQMAGGDDVQLIKQEPDEDVEEHFSWKYILSPLHENICYKR